MLKNILLTNQQDKVILGMKRLKFVQM